MEAIAIGWVNFLRCLVIATRILLYVTDFSVLAVFMVRLPCVFTSYVPSVYTSQKTIHFSCALNKSCRVSVQTCGVSEEIPSLTSLRCFSATKSPLV